MGPRTSTLAALALLIGAALPVRADQSVPDPAWYKARADEVAQVQLTLLRLPYDCREEVKERVFDALEIACVDRRVAELSSRLTLAATRYPELQKSVNELKNCVARDKAKAPTGYYGYRCVSEKSTAAYTLLGATLDDLYARARLTELDQTLKDPAHKPHRGKATSKRRKQVHDDVQTLGPDGGQGGQTGGAGGANIE